MLDFFSRLFGYSRLLRLFSDEVNGFFRVFSKDGFINIKDLSILYFKEKVSKFGEVLRGKRY